MMLSWESVKQEMLATPGRANATLRLTLSCTLLTILFLSLQIPFLAVAIIVVFYVSQSNVVTTAGIGIGFVLIALLALGGMLLIIKWTYDFPLIRLIASLTLFFWAMFFMRVLGKLGLAFFVVALILIYAQTFPSMTSQSEILVRLILWLWAAMAVAISVTVLVNACFRAAYPEHQFRYQVARLYRQTADRLSGATMKSSPISDTAVQFSQLMTLHKLASLTDVIFKANQESWYSLANLSIRSAEWVESYRLNSHSRDKATTEQIADIFRQLATQIEQGKPLVSIENIAPCDDPILTQIILLIDQLANDEPVAPPSGEHVKAPLMLADTWHNPIYLQFALKTLLASLLCYVFYTATAWQGVHTIMLSCVIVAQPGLGATYQKAILRVVGVLIAAIFALFLMVFIQPHLDSIIGLLMMSVPLFALSAWVASGSERIAYAGIQCGFTFALIFLSSFAPMSNLTELRDRVIGILLGVMVASIVYLYLWPDSDAPRLKQRMTQLYLQLATYFSSGAVASNAQQLYQQFDETAQVAVKLEAEPLTSITHPHPEARNWPVQESLQRAQQLLRLAQGYRCYATPNDPFLSASAVYLTHYAHAIEQTAILREEIEAEADLRNPYAQPLIQHLRSLPVWRDVPLPHDRESDNE